MKLRWMVWVGILGIVGLMAYLALEPFRDSSPRPLFELSGPEGISSVVAVPPTPISRYGTGSSSRLAVLITNPDSGWLGLAHGLKAIGVPFVVTDDYRRALGHKVILVYPVFSGGWMSPEALRAIMDHSRNGGTLIAQNAIGAGMRDVFGFDESVPSRARLKMTLAERQPGGVELSDPLERTFQLGHPDQPDQGLGTYGFTNPREIPLAVFDDGTAAITRRTNGRGQAYAVGLDIGDFILRGYNVRADWLTRSYINEYEPASDTLLRWLRGVYRDAEPDAVTLGTVPDGRTFSLVISHDVDAQKSLNHSISYARYEASRGIRATYFIQAKYLKDWYDKPLLDKNTAGILAELSNLGMEVASHSVSHSIVFETLPLGSGDERYPEYHPVFLEEKSTAGASVLGELRVSKFLLEQLGNRDVTSFRSGYLRNPETLSQALLATGYRFSSTATVGETLTNLPFQMNYDRKAFAEVPVFEFPVVIDDTRPISFDELLVKAIHVIERISRYGGICVVLIHPNVAGAKLEFEQKLVATVQDKAWTGSIRDLGMWWAARNAISVDVTTMPRGKTIELDIPEEIEGLTVNVPPDWTLEGCLPEGAATVQTPGIVLLHRVSGKVSLIFRGGTGGRIE